MINASKASSLDEEDLTVYGKFQCKQHQLGKSHLAIRILVDLSTSCDSVAKQKD
jgi:hypothetical protein